MNGSTNWGHRIDDAFHRGRGMAELLGDVYNEGIEQGKRQMLERMLNQDFWTHNQKMLIRAWLNGGNI